MVGTSSNLSQNVYWLNEEIYEWIKQRRSLASVVTLFINGKEGNWDGEDTTPFLVHHITNAPRLICNIIWGNK